MDLGNGSISYPSAFATVFDSAALITAARTMRAAETEYDDVAEDYERHVAPKFGVVAERLAELASLWPGQQVLELGAGTGALSRLIAPRVRPEGHVVLLDLSRSMLEVAARVLKAAACDNVTLVCEDMASLPFIDGQFDVVLSHMGYFEESQKAAHEAFRVLRPSGRIAIAVWGPLTRHQEWRLLRPARTAAGIRGRWVPSIGEAMGRVTRAGFVDMTTREERFEIRFESVDAYIMYRHCFGFRPQPYFATLRREAKRRSNPDGSLVVGWTATLLVASRP